MVRLVWMHRRPVAEDGAGIAMDDGWLELPLLLNGISTATWDDEERDSKVHFMVILFFL